MSGDAKRLRGIEIAEALLGTCDDIEKHATDAERADPVILEAIDDTVERCDLCDWWCEPSEIEDGECKDCRES